MMKLSKQYLSKRYYENLWKSVHTEGYNILYNHSYISTVSIFILIFEIILNIYIINHVNYTEIDWRAYMQEVEGFLNGTTDYSKLKGDTGPLVYPAGFVYIFSLFYYITNNGYNIKFAQYIYAGLYMITLYLLFRIYNNTKKVPPYVLVISCCISYRIHSIFVLRLFNDPIAVLLLYLSINLFLLNKWTLGSIVYSLAVSVKMNILLYAPALFLSYITVLGVTETIKHLTICALIQLILGLPFLLTNYKAYMIQSFNLGRIFLHKWTVNYRFLSESIFVNTYFHIFLFCVHLCLLAIFSFSSYKHLKSFAVFSYTKNRIKKELKKHKRKLDMSTASRLLVLPFFVCNFIGIMCSRSLHYQFYVWYYHTLPYLLWSTNFSDKIRLTIFGIIELCWNTYPSTNLSSLSLHICHIIILYGLYINR